MKRKICVITGSRAEYGLLKPLMEEIKKDDSLSLRIIATSMHMSPEFGLTYKEIEKDGFDIDEKVAIRLSSDTPLGISRSMGIAIIGLSKACERVKPDLIVMLGDRFELLSAATTALVMRIPIAHIHGGELTEGVFDDAMRHAITKMSHLHFTATEAYRKRVIQLGEDPLTVFNVGAVGLDDIKKLKLLSKKELEKKLNFKFGRRSLLVTFHPVTLENNTSRKQFQQILNALDSLKETNIIFTKSNADTYGRVINIMIDRYVKKNRHRRASFTSMGRLKYLSAMQFVDAVIGNSSSGIIEAPSFKIATINIGDRQRGRVKAKSIVDCKPTETDIRKAFNTVFSQRFKASLKTVTNPYERDNTARNIKNVIKNYIYNKNSNNLKKRFYDMPVIGK